MCVHTSGDHGTVKVPQLLLSPLSLETGSLTEPQTSLVVNKPWQSSWLQLIPPTVGVTDVPCHARDFCVGVWDSNSHPRVCIASVLNQ